MLEGEAVLEPSAVSTARGEGLHVPPGTAHQMHNVSTTDVHFLVVSSPKSHGDRALAALAEDAA